MNNDPCLEESESKNWKWFRKTVILKINCIFRKSSVFRASYCLMRTYRFSAMNSLLVEFVALFQNTNGIAFFLIDKNNAEYYRNTILVSNSNDTSGVYNMCLHLIVIMPLPPKRCLCLKINSPIK